MQECQKGKCSDCTDNKQCDTNLVCNVDSGKCVASCDKGWSSIGTSCYMISVNKKNYIDALAQCKSHGNNSRLAEVEDEGTNTLLGRLLVNKNYVQILFRKLFLLPMMIKQINYMLYQ